MGEAAISNYSVSWLLERADPIAYQVGLNDYESFMLSEHEDDASMYSEWFDEDGDLTRKGEQEIPAIYDESLDEMGTEWLANKYNASWLLKRGDPIAYRVGLSDYESSMEEDFDAESFNARGFESTKWRHKETGEIATVISLSDMKNWERVIPKNADSQSESLVEEPAWIPAGDGRALGQQNFGINMSPLHAESQESMILEACGICDKDFASETLNADGYCGSCCDSRLAEFDNRIDFSAETDDEGRTAPNECPTCGETDYMWVNNGSWDCDQCSCLVYDAESKISNNAQIALGLTALGVGLALWKSNDILNLFNKFRGE